MYTVTLTTQADWVTTNFTAKVDNLKEAAMRKRAWEHNQPYLKGQVVVFDQDDYLVPSTELNQALRIVKQGLLNELAYLEDIAA